MPEFIGYFFALIVSAWMAAIGTYNTFDFLRDLPDVMKATVADHCLQPEKTNVWKFVAEQMLFVLLSFFWPLIGLGGIGSFIALVGDLL